MDKTTIPALAKYPDINGLLGLILARIREILGEKLVGLYLYGSLVGKDFDYEISDIDLLTATVSDISEEEFGDLDKTHADLIKNNPQWENRLEIAYLSLRALKTFKTEICRAAIISPGEPFHFREAGKHWSIDWYSVRENGATLFGPPPETIIEPISKEEFIQAVREQANEWHQYVENTKHSRSFQAYAILTICRAFYAVKNGEQVSKKRAALWAKTQFPEWAYLIQNAMRWRKAFRENDVNHEQTFPETKKFVHLVINLIADFS